MQLICSGQRLDLYENTDLQFTEENPLFAFDSIKCERTTNFKLPATPANDRAFSLARIPAYAGEGMRRKFPAQLQMGTIVKDGYLYVSSWNGKEYEAIFVTGEMVGLQQLRDAGKLADLVSYATIQWSPAYVRDANTAAGKARFAITRYKTNANLCMPSYDFAEILDEAYHTATLQTGAWYLPDKVSGMRVIAKEINSLGKLPFIFKNTPAEVAPAEVAPSSAPTAGSITFTYQYANLFARVYKPVQAAKTVSGATHAYYIKVQHLICGQTILLTMPDDISPDLFLMSIEAKNGGGQGDPTDPEYTPLAQEWFLGDYSFNYNVAQGSGIVVSGTPLAGKTIKIPARTPFVFINKNAFKWQQQGIDFLDGLWNVGFSGAPGMAYSVTMQSEGASVEQGNVVRIEQVISDITLCDALKIYANLIGKQLYYTDKDGVQFDDLFFISWPRFDISKRLLSIGKVTRTFSDYAQHNLVQFDSADDVPQNTRVITEYTLDNDNISETKDVGKIPFNEGEIDAADGVIVARFDAEDVEKNTLPKYGIAVAGQSQFMERVQLPKNAGIQALCDASTQVEVQARMSAYEYAQITAKTRILCRGTEYVWTSRQWQEDTAKFVLAKLPPLDYYGLTAEARAEIESAYGFDVLVQVYRYVAGFPAVVPFINEDPHLVCSLVNTGYKRFINGDGRHDIEINMPIKTTDELVFDAVNREGDAYCCLFATYPDYTTAFWFSRRYYACAIGGYEVLPNGTLGEHTIKKTDTQWIVDNVVVQERSIPFAEYSSFKIFNRYGTPPRYITASGLRSLVVNNTISFVPCVHNQNNGLLRLPDCIFDSNADAGAFTITEESI